MHTFKLNTKIFPKDKIEITDILDAALAQGWGGICKASNRDQIMSCDCSVVIYFDAYNSRHIVSWDEVEKDNLAYEVIEWSKNVPENTLPKEFVITNADNMAVRQWLKDLGYIWRDGRSLTGALLEKDTLSCGQENYEIGYGPLEFYKEHHRNLPIITPIISATGVEITHLKPNKSVKEIEIENMKKQIFEMQESLKKLEAEKNLN